MTNQAALPSPPASAAASRPPGISRSRRKIGFTNRTIWAEYNVYEPVWGYVYNRTVHNLAQIGDTFSLMGLAEPRIEPEIVFKLGLAPAPGMDETALLACIDWVGHGFEIVQSIFPGWKFSAPDTVAAFGLHGALLIGPRHSIAAHAEDWSRTLSTFEIDLKHDGTVVDQGRATNLLGGPVSALRHLVDILARDQVNPPLAAGEIVTTGTLTRAHSPHGSFLMNADPPESPALPVAKIEEDHAHAVFAALGAGNVPVFCSRETWKAWWEANPGGKVVKSEQAGGFVTEITFTGFSSERDGPLKFWTVDSHNTQTRMCYSLGSFTTLEEAVAFLESTRRTKLGVVPVGLAIPKIYPPRQRRLSQPRKERHFVQCRRARPHHDHLRARSERDVLDSRRRNFLYHQMRKAPAEERRDRHSFRPNNIARWIIGLLALAAVLWVLTHLLSLS